MDVSNVLLIVGLCLVAIQTRHIITYTGAFVALLFFGFSVFETDVMLGVALVIFAGYMLYGAIQWFWSRT